MPEKTDQFVKKYHAAMVMATKDRTEKLESRIASEWVKDWEAELDGPIVDEEEFRQKFQEFLKDELGFAGSANVSIEGDELRIQVEQCSICHGNEVLRSRGEPTLCPILPTGLLSISRVLKRNTELLGVEKPGPVGFCTIKYGLLKPKK
ncbi:MAG: hypothetical protein MUP40_04555 [Actinobacteria bacterium]|nr:hypothetical protein [Actinomycetota bacterium]